MVNLTVDNHSRLYDRILVNSSQYEDRHYHGNVLKISSFMFTATSKTFSEVSPVTANGLGSYKKLDVLSVWNLDTSKAIEFNVHSNLVLCSLHAFFYKEPIYKESTCRRPKYLKNLYY